MYSPDRELGRPAAWHDLVELIRKINPYPGKIDIMLVTEIYG